MRAPDSKQEQSQAELEEARAEAIERLAAALAQVASEAGKETEEITRFSLAFRLQHMVLFSGCVLLILTGLPLKFPDSAWARIFFGLTSGVPASAVVHRIGATALIGVGAFHMGYITFTAEGRREFLQLLPRLKDVKDVFANVRYFLGLARRGARFGRFSYVEKFDYWAVYWGMVVMIASGAMLWFQDLTMSVLPKYYLDMALEAHSDEALLATLAIIIWHFYNVHFNPSNFPLSWTWWTGRISKQKMMEHHPLEYQELVARARGGEGEPEAKA